MSLDITAINTGFPTGNRYNPISSEVYDTKVHDAEDGYKPVDSGTKPYIDKPDEAWKYRTSLGSTDTITDINNTYNLARYLFIGTNTGVNALASEQFMKQQYQNQGAAKKFFTLA